MYLNLNENQLKAVNKTEGPLRIISGPGSGKTKTIVSKIVHILENNLARPEEILTITFTNKAAREIKNRIIEEKVEVKNIFTYHGWCHYFLRIESESAQINKDFVIIDSEDSKSRINNLIKENSLTIEKHLAYDIFEKIAREEIEIDSFKDSENPFYTQVSYTQVSMLWNKYKDDKRVNGQLDFNDLILEVKKLLTTNSEISNKWKNKYKYIFIDEFQDTNNIQFEIVKAITDSNSNITVVGDPDQNIYSWRGANIELINNFTKWYPTAETIMLNINYRSTPEIINSSNALIKNNKNRVTSFASEPNKPSSQTVQIISKENEFEESRILVKEILKLKYEGFSFHDIAVIVRSSYKTRPLEAALNNENIPYRVIGAMKFFDRKEVKQTLKFLLFSVKQDNNTLLDIINEPPKKFGPQKISKAKAAAEDNNSTIWEYMLKNTKEQIEPIQTWIIQTQKMIAAINNEDDVSDVLEMYLDDIGYINRLFNEPSRKENIKETLKIIRKSINEKSNKSLKEKIINFINNANLSSSSDKSIEDGEVNIITAHASKGTEFPIVFLFSMVEGHWPLSKAIENNSLEEERRVAYVAMTRAMDRLYITLSDGFNPYSKQAGQSRFINELLIKNTYNYVDTNISKSKSFYEEEDISKPIKPNVDYEEENTESSKIGSKIFHNTFGEGEIIDNDKEFITIQFTDGRKQEILLGHKSYKVMK